jgi:tripartite-type tricarboxylate transporter receptor subunit TctC
MTAIISAEVELGITSMLAVLPHIKSGRLRALGVSGAKRSPAAPEQFGAYVNEEFRKWAKAVKDSGAGVD